MTQHAAQRGGNVGGRKTSGCYLVEQRLEQVKVPFVDQGDTYRRMTQRLGCIESAESAPYNYNMMRAVHEIFFFPATCCLISCQEVLCKMMILFQLYRKTTAKTVSFPLFHRKGDVCVALKT
jgi:hypothetical protein